MSDPTRIPGADRLPGIVMSAATQAAAARVSGLRSFSLGLAVKLLPGDTTGRGSKERDVGSGEGLG
jgi:hypothetical protein